MGINSTSVSKLLELMEYDQKAFEAYYTSLSERLILYARFSLKLDESVGIELVQDVMVDVISRIKAGELKEVLSFEAYMMQALKYKSNKIKELDSLYLSFDETKADPEEIEKSDEIESEQFRFLMLCLDNLSIKNRRFFFFVLRHLPKSDQQIAKKIRMKYEIFRTRKSRLIHILHECVQQYLSPQIEES